MSLHRPFVSAFVWLSVVVLSSTASAQHGHHGDSADLTNLYDPFCEVDTDWFEPIYCDCSDERPLNSGWYFKYDRTNLNISRPKDEPRSLTFDPGTANGNILPSSYQGAPAADYEGDWAWGNRFDLGYVTPAGDGWWIIAQRISNPRRIEQTDNIDLNGVDSVRPNGDPWGDTFVTLNGFNLWGVEVNKVWRLPPTPKGTILEPFVGPRYVRLRDHSDRNDVYTDTLDFPTVGIAGESRIDRFDFNYQTNRVTTDNSLFGGQFGLRSRWRRGRLQLVSDVRGLLFFNRQQLERYSINEQQYQDFTATYGADGIGGGILTGVTATGPTIQYETSDEFYQNRNEFVYGGELHLDSSFYLTQAFAVRGGLEITVFADGVGRGYSAQNDSLVLAGYSIGFEINR